jgi:hypothetical protein
MSQVKTTQQPTEGMTDALAGATPLDTAIYRASVRGSSRSVRSAVVDLKSSAGQGFGDSVDAAKEAKKLFKKSEIKQSLEAEQPEAEAPIAPVEPEAPKEEEVKQPVIESKPEAQTVTVEMLNQTLALIETKAIAPLKQSLEAEQTARVALEAQLKQSQAEIAARDEKIKEQESGLSILNNLQRLTGLGAASEPQEPSNSYGQSAHIAKESHPLGIKMQGAFGEFMQSLSNMPSVLIESTKTQKNEVLYPTAELDAFVRSNKSEFMQSLEQSMKQAGLLGGMNGNRSIGQGYNNVQQAATVKADVVAAFLPALSSLMRMNNKPGFIWWQFATTQFNFLRGQGDTIQIPRIAYQTRPAASADRRLSGNGIFAAINATNQNLASGTVSLTLSEYGLGKDASNNPIGIPTFTEKYSLLGLLEAARSNLWYDYCAWEDVSILERFEPTSRVYYNKKGTLATASTSLAVGDSGQCTYEFIMALTSEAKSSQIPTFADGCYVYCVPSPAIPALRKSLDTFLRTENNTSPELVRDIVQQASGQVDFKVEGYVGKIANVHVFEGNSWGVGAAGSRGVQSENDGAAVARVTRTGFFFGAGAVGRGVGQEFSIVTRSGEVNWNRLIECIWTSHEEFVALDVDPTGYSDVSTVPQQLRVFETHTTDVAI